MKVCIFGSVAGLLTTFPNSFKSLLHNSAMDMNGVLAGTLRMAAHMLKGTFRDCIHDYTAASVSHITKGY